MITIVKRNCNMKMSNHKNSKRTNISNNIIVIQYYAIPIINQSDTSAPMLHVSHHHHNNNNKLLNIT